jgi:hypothetical protein
MNTYFEVKLLPSSEFEESVLLNALYPKIHHALFHGHMDKLSATPTRIEACRRLWTKKETLTCRCGSVR